MVVNVLRVLVFVEVLKNELAKWWSAQIPVKHLGVREAVHLGQKGHLSDDRSSPC